jgi:hypothetical protein
MELQPFRLIPDKARLRRERNRALQTLPSRENTDISA